jgi:ArsR family transcriptional regulator, arsenate/arsenite/antimonite-responsive transcriptional repressor / arsenate reductase (thioredoxin)
MDHHLVPVPEMLKLVSHEVRWNVLRLLARSDYRVQELVEVLSLPQNLVSYHLKLLREGHLVHERRSSADERALYYTLDFERLLTWYAQVANDLHPAVGAQVHPQETHEWDLPKPPLRVLFLCTENSARSQMAEALLRALSHGNIEAMSAGSAPAGQVHPLAIRVMQEAGIAMHDAVPKSLNSFRQQHFATVITVCDRAREVCPSFPGHPDLIHWSLPDPVLVQGSEEVRYYAFKQTAEHLRIRLEFLLPLLEQAYLAEKGRRA